jgi:hypothetical protein
MSIPPEDVGGYIVRLRELEKHIDYMTRDTDVRYILTDVRYLLGVTEAAVLLWATHEEYGGVLGAHEMAMQFRRLSAALRDDLGDGYGKPSRPETTP